MNDARTRSAVGRPVWEERSVNVSLGEGRNGDVAIGNENTVATDKGSEFAESGESDSRADNECAFELLVDDDGDGDCVEDGGIHRNDGGSRMAEECF